MNKYKCILLSNIIIDKYNLYNIRDLFLYPLYNSKKQETLKSLDFNLEYGILLCLETKIINYLNNELDTEIKRINFVKNKNFLNYIKSKCLLICNKNICEIWELQFNMYSKIILNEIYNHLNKKDIILWISTKINHKSFISLLINLNFHNPYICNKSPFGSELNNDSLCMYNDRDTVNKHITINILKYINKHYNLRHKYCFMLGKFTRNAISILKKIPFKHSNEIAGVLTIIDVKSKKSRPSSQFDKDSIAPSNSGKESIIFYIDIINGTKTEGENENIIIENDRYTFHSHPIDAYIKYNVKYGWPSGQDYVGYLQGLLSVKCIFHVVTTKEGIYIISLSKEYSKKNIYELKDMGDKFLDYIYKNYSIPKNAFKSPYEYIKYINNKLKIFFVTFLEWKNIDSEFIVYFPKNNKNCIV